MTAPTAPKPAAADDDDGGSDEHPIKKFQEKYPESADKMQPRQGGHSRRNRIIAFLLAAALFGGVVLAVAVAISATAPQNSPPPAEEGAGADMTVRTWHSTDLPVSATEGPLQWSDTSASGFSQSALGAALAAVHISVRLDPYTSPSVFEPALKRQVISSNKEAISKKLHEEYEKARKLTDTAAGQPIAAAVGQITAYRIAADSEDGTDVDLYVQTPTAGDMIYTVPLKWDDGDWKIAPRSETSLSLPTSPVNPDHQYTQFL